MVTQGKGGPPGDIPGRQPRTALELARIHDALRAPPSCLPFGRCWIIASTEAPMHRVFGAVETLPEAQERIRSARKDGALGWTKSELASLAPYGEFELDEAQAAPAGKRPSSSNLTQPWHACWHDCFSEWFCPSPPMDGDSILGMELRVQRRGFKPVVIPIPKSADMVVLRESAWVKFILPHYERTYGRDYVDRLRKLHGGKG
jgi:hypothetical protein